MFLRGQLIGPQNVQHLSWREFWMREN